MSPTDGPTDAAGAVVDGYTLARSLEAGLDLGGYMKENDAYHFFKELGDGLIFTGAAFADCDTGSLLLAPPSR